MKQRKSIINNSDNDNYSVSSSTREKDESESRRGLTSLDPNTVRYLNKRKPSDKSNSAYTFHATRANAMIFLPIFEGLPSYCNGSISFEDLEDAVHHLSKPYTGQNPIFENPRETSLFFRSMDTCNSGTLNFREFALGMSNFPGHSVLTTLEISRIREAFEEYSSRKRREEIIRKSSDPLISDARRFSELKKLLYLSRPDITGAGKCMESIDEHNGICSKIVTDKKPSRKKEDENIRQKMAKDFQNEKFEKPDETDLLCSRQNTENINYVLDSNRLYKNSLESISGKSMFNDTENYNRILYHTKPQNNPHKLKKKMTNKLRSIKNIEGHHHYHSRVPLILGNIGNEPNMKLKSILAGNKSILSSETPIDKIYNIFEKPIISINGK